MGGTMAMGDCPHLGITGVIILGFGGYGRLEEKIIQEAVSPKTLARRVPPPIRAFWCDIF